MKKTFLVLAMLILAAPVFAGITITAKQIGTTGVVEVNYVMSVGDANIPRAFALDVNMSPANDSILNPSRLDPNFYVALGGTTFDSNYVPTWGAQFVNKTTTGFTTEMGSLWATNDGSHPSQPKSKGTLFQFTVDKNCTITLAQNAIRGGVVMEKTSVTFPPSYVTLVNGTVTGIGAPADCLYVGRVFAATAGSPILTVTQTMVDKWVILGKPNCWCCVAQKRGNGIYTPSGTATKVDNSDALAVKNASAWMKTYTQAGYLPCSDVDLSGKIDNVDALRIKNAANWMQQVGAGSGCQ